MSFPIRPFTPGPGWGVRPLPQSDPRIDLSHVSRSFSHDAPIVQKITSGGASVYAETAVDRFGNVGSSFFGD